MNEELIAPCGMNCGICSGYLAMSNDLKSQGVKMTCCIGCRPRDKNCAFIKKQCDLLRSGKIQYCYECDDFPCRNLKHLDKRYGSLYRMSMIENQEIMKKEGVAGLLVREEEKWKCPECGGVICCHNGICYSCGLERLKNRDKKKMYRWEDE